MAQKSNLEFTSDQLIEHIDKLAKQGYAFRIQEVDGRIFVFGKNLRGSMPDVSCISKTFKECLEKIIVEGGS